MAFSDKEFFIGAMFWRMVRNVEQPLVVEATAEHSDVVFVNQHPLYIKIARQRKSPWQFTFSAENLKCISMLQKNRDNCIVALICGHDGDVCLNQEQFSSVVNLQSCCAEWIRISREQGKQYSVSGSLGKLTGKIPINSLSRQFLS